MSPKKTLQSISPTDLVYLILGLTFDKHSLQSIPRDYVYKGFEALSNRHPQDFPDFYFVQRGTIPHSNELEDILFRLGGVMECSNPGYQHMRFSNKSLEVVQKRFQRICSDTQIQNEIIKLVEEFFAVTQELEEPEHASSLRTLPKRD